MTSSPPPAVVKADIVAGLRRLGVAPGDTALVHSSLSAFGRVEGGADAVIDAVLEALGPDGTAVFPAFNWRKYHAITEPVVFDVAHESVKDEVGTIPETFRLRPGVLRSAHICHSITALGPKAKYIMGPDVKSWGRESAFGRLEELNAWNLLLGVKTTSCTALHHCEDLMQVPYRAYRDFSGSVVILPDGRREPCRAVEFLPKPGNRADFAKMEAVFAENGVLSTTTVGNAKLLAVRMQDLVRVTTACLKENNRFLLVK
jgi:aminoglycoside 3-N-acetyltransferase